MLTDCSCTHRVQVAEREKATLEAELAAADGEERVYPRVLDLSAMVGLQEFGELHRHLAASAVLPRSAEVDLPMLELLLGCEFLSDSQAVAALAPYMQTADFAAAGGLAEGKIAAGDAVAEPISVFSPLPEPLDRLSEDLQTPPQDGFGDEGHGAFGRRSPAVMTRCTPHESL